MHWRDNNKLSAQKGRFLQVMATAISVLPPDLFFSIFATASVLVTIGGRDRYDEGVITRGDLDKAIEGHHPHRMCEEDQE